MFSDTPIPLSEKLITTESSIFSDLTLHVGFFLVVVAGSILQNIHKDLGHTILVCQKHIRLLVQLSAETSK